MMAKILTKVRSKITSKNQVTIPKTVRDLLNVKSADTIEWQIEPNGTVMIVQSKPDLWQVVDQQAQKYGKVNTPEVDWGTDLESEDFD